MKLIKFGLRFWITLTSVASFLVGWALLAHSPKPVQTSSAQQGAVQPLTSVPTLAPLQPLDFSNNNNSGSGFQNVPIVIQQSNQPSFMPMFTTSGS